MTEEQEFLISLIYVFFMTFISVLCFCAVDKDLHLTFKQTTLLAIGFYFIQPFCEFFIGFVKGIIK